MFWIKGFYSPLKLNVSRRASEAERWMRTEKHTENGWLKFMAHSPEGKKLGIFGLGSIGKQIAKRAKAFDMEIHYHNRYSEEATE